MTAGEFATSLREHRQVRGLTQDQLSGLSTISVRAIRDLETGHAGKPRQATIRLLADGLGLRGDVRTAFLAAGRGSELPLPLTSLLGRDLELRALTDLLLDGHRLVTVTGLTGVGKTRLAVELAHRMADTFTVRWNTLRFLSAEPALLVLDGVDAVPPEVPGLLRRYPDLRVLVTAIAPLGEHVVPLTPLDVPVTDDEAEVRAATSARLLARRIRALDPSFRLDRDTAAAVAEVCRRCDGHPGALELAGTWCALWSPAEVAGMLRADDPARLPDHTDLTAVVGRSLLALNVRERRVLTRLAALDGAWTVGEAAAALYSDPGTVMHAVHTLLRAGLLRRTGPARFRALGLTRCLRAAPLRRATA